MDSSSTQADRSIITQCSNDRSNDPLPHIFQQTHLTQGKKPESASSFFAIHTNGIFFFEISSNVFKPPKEIEKYNWRDIKEIQVGSAKIQFVLRSHDLGGGGGVSNSSKVKIYLDEWKARHVFDMAETYHAHHISCCTNNSPSDATPFENLPKIVKNDALNDVFRTFCKKVKR